VRLESNDVGTFLFPPSSYSDVSEYLSFWGNVDISDGVLANITAGYADLVRRQTNLLSVDWGHKYDRENEHALRQGSPESREAARESRDAAHIEMQSEWYVTHPPRIKATWARNIARAGQISYFRTALDEARWDDIVGSTIMVGTEEITVRDANERYQLGQIREYFVDPEVSAAERLEQLRQDLMGMTIS
jgi:hypothetical protein